MSTRPNPKGTKAPDQIPLTALQAARLASVSGLPAKELAGRTHAELSERLRWYIDPLWWRFQRVCGRVVKRDPASGVEYGVPNATVLVEDTDCNLVLYAPPSLDVSRCPVGGALNWIVS